MKDRWKHCRYLENTDCNKLNKECIKSDNCEELIMIKEWFKTEKGPTRVRTFICTKYDKLEDKCSQWEWGGKCSKKNSKYCFKNHPEFFEEV